MGLEIENLMRKIALPKRYFNNDFIISDKFREEMDSFVSRKVFDILELGLLNMNLMLFRRIQMNFFISLFPSEHILITNDSAWRVSQVCIYQQCFL